MKQHFFSIGGHYTCIRFNDTDGNDLSLLPSFHCFAADEPSCSQPLLFTLTVDDSLRPAKGRQLIRKFDTGNGDTVVHRLPDGGYQYIIKDVYDRECCLLISNADFSECTCALNGDWTMRSFGLNDAIMLVYAFRGVQFDTLLIHASCIRYKEHAFPFTAQSGTGKSTHTSLWLKHIEGCDLMNDDNPIIRIINGTPYVFGSPWSGKTPCYRNISAKLGAVTQIERAPTNYITKQSVVQSFALLLPSCSSMKWDEKLYGKLCDILTKIIQTTPVYVLSCRPDEEAARVSFQALASCLS